MRTSPSDLGKVHAPVLFAAKEPVRRRLAAILCFVLCLGAPLDGAAGVFPEGPFSDRAAGTTGAAFLKLPTSARAVALGSAFVAAVDNSESMFWNPAGLARFEEQSESELSFGYSALLETSYAGTVAYARPFANGRGVLGAAFVYFSQASIRGFNTLGDPDGSFTPNDFAFVVHYAKKLEQVSLGGGLKFIRSELADVSGSSFALDLGIQSERVFDLGEGPVDLGASMRNLGPPIQVGSVADPLPFVLQLGALWHISPRVRALLDGHLPVDDDPYPSLGLEFLQPMGENLAGALRAGYNLRNDRDVDGLSGVSGGFGVMAGRFRFDYAWVPFGDVGTTHRISLGLLF